jgi:hypothetical protein
LLLLEPCWVCFEPTWLLAFPALRFLRVRRGGGVWKRSKIRADDKQLTIKSTSDKVFEIEGRRKRE